MSGNGTETWGLNCLITRFLITTRDVIDNVKWSEEEDMDGRDFVTVCDV